MADIYNELQVEEEGDTSEKVKHVLRERMIISLLLKTYFCLSYFATTLSVFWYPRVCSDQTFFVQSVI